MIVNIEIYPTEFLVDISALPTVFNVEISQGGGGGGGETLTAEQIKAEEDRLAKVKELQLKYSTDIANLKAPDDQSKLDLEKSRAQAELNAMSLHGDEKLKLQALLDEKYRISQSDLNAKKDADLATYMEKFIAKNKEYAEADSVAEVESIRVKNEQILNKEREDAIALAIEKASNHIATAEQLKTIDDYYDALDLENTQKAADEKIAIDETVMQAKLELLGLIGNGIGALGALFEQGTAASKTAAIAEIAIGSAVGFIQGLDIAQKGAKGTGPLAPYAFPIFYATQAVAILGAVARAKSALSSVKGGSGGLGSIGSGGAVSAGTMPNVSFMASSENQIANGITNKQPEQAPIKAYVVSQDMSTQQQLDRNLVNTTTL